MQWRCSYHTRGVGPTCGFPNAITYDEAAVNHIWKIPKIREDCIGDPISMTVDAHKQDGTPAKEGFTVEVILHGMWGQ